MSINSKLITLFNREHVKPQKWLINNGLPGRPDVALLALLFLGISVCSVYKPIACICPYVPLLALYAQLMIIEWPLVAIDWPSDGH